MVKASVKVAWAAAIAFSCVAGHKLPLTQPYECFQTEFRSELGVLKVGVTARGNAKLRVFVNKGRQCVDRDASPHVPVLASGIASAVLQQVAEVFVTQATEPAIERGWWSVAVEGQDVIPGQSVDFDVAVSNPLNGGAGPSAAGVGAILAAATMTCVALLRGCDEGWC